MGRLGRLLAAITTALCAANAQATTSLTVMVYNYSDLPGAKLTEAEAIASRSYGSAGVKVDWLACSSVQQDTDEFRACDRAIDAASPYIRVEPESMAAGSHRSGRWTMRWGPRWGRSAIILYPRIRATARQWNCPEELILGRVIAHELGHIYSAITVTHRTD
jgi:hypothetical protein